MPDKGGLHFANDPIICLICLPRDLLYAMPTASPTDLSLTSTYDKFASNDYMVRALKTLKACLSFFFKKKMALMSFL